MSEFQPEDAVPHPDAAAQGAPPVQGMVAPPPPPPPYGQAAPPMPYAAWDGPPPAWSPAPAKKRKAWPWVVGIVGGLVVLGGAGTALALGVFGAMNADQNDNYEGEPITAGDAPTIGDEVLISDSGAVAFDIGPGWVDANELVDVTSAVGTLPEGGSLIATYFTTDPNTATSEKLTLVMVVEAVPPHSMSSIDLKVAHDGYMKGVRLGADAAGVNLEASEASAITTANGLEGLVTSLAIDVEDMTINAYEYTFARGQRVVYVQIMSYNGPLDDATAALVTDSLRIDK